MREGRGARRTCSASSARRSWKILSRAARSGAAAGRLGGWAARRSGPPRDGRPAVARELADDGGAARVAVALRAEGVERVGEDHGLVRGRAALRLRRAGCRGGVLRRAERKAGPRAASRG